MKLKRTFIWLFGAVALLAACGESSSSEEPAPGPDPGDGDGGNENTEYVAPEPPEEVNSSNLLQLRVLTTLSDETLFGNVDPADVADWISPSTENVLMYLFERADFRLGEPLPQVEIGLATRSFSYFVQTEETSEHVQGTGIVTRHQASEIDAVHLDENGHRRLAEVLENDRFPVRPLYAGRIFWNRSVSDHSHKRYSVPEIWPGHAHDVFPQAAG